MYRILVHKPGMAKDTFSFYMVPYQTEVVENGIIKKKDTLIIYEAETLAELTEKYNELLATYTTEQLFPIDMLKVTLSTTIEDETDN